ncbi:MAG: metallophosphoesterase family protein, partial [Myxococcota bacterium]
MRIKLFGTALAILVFATGCPPSDRQEEPDGEQNGAEQEAVEQEAAERETEDGTPSDPLAAVSIEVPAGGDAAIDSPSGESDPECVGKLDAEGADSFEIDGWKVEVEGYRATLTRTGEEAPEELALGVIADIKEDTGENMYNIGRFIEWWRSMKVEAVVVPGDAGETAAGLARVLGALAEPGWPVLVLSGNREAKDEYREGVAKAQQEHRNIFDLSKIRLVSLPGASLVSLPGYHDARFLHEETACQYFREDVAALIGVAREAEDPVVLVAHSGPRGATAHSIDYAREAGNVGDGNLNRLIEAARIPFGIFGHILEAGGKATDLAGHDLRAEGAYTNSLYLNAG